VEKTVVGICGVLVLAAGIVVSCGISDEEGQVSERGWNAKATPNMQKLERALSWIPPETETLMILSGPFDDLSSRVSQTAESGAREELTSMLRELPYRVGGTDNDSLSMLGPRENILFVVEADRMEFMNAINGRNRLVHAACQVIVFAQECGEISLLCRDAFNGSAHQCGKYVMFETGEADGDKIFVSQPEPNVVLCSNNRSFQEEFLDRIARNGVLDREIMQTPDVRWLANTQNALWAERRYSDLARVDAQASLDDGAASLVVNYDPSSDNGSDAVIRVVYSSEVEFANDTMNKFWTYPDDPEWTPIVESSVNGVIMFTIVLTSKDHVIKFFFLLMSNLGQDFVI
jgi:hypothetical protein